MEHEQMALFSFKSKIEPKNGESEWGTFKDSLRAPIHGWFTYPAGFSYKAVESSIKEHRLKPGEVIYDPFMGTGTTNLTAKANGFNSYGVEAHPFVFRIAQTKLNWGLKGREILGSLGIIEKKVRKRKENFSKNVSAFLKSEFPELVLKCYEEKTLLDLCFIRDAILNSDFKEAIERFLNVALTGVLRDVSTAHTGWPYIAPNKQKTSSLNKNAVLEYTRQVVKMVGDVERVLRETNGAHLDTFHKTCNGDSRNTKKWIGDLSVDHVFTSPPYLNNFDYADRTRLELYFFGEAKTWGDITRNIRTKLMTSATTQIEREDQRYILSEDLKEKCPDVASFLTNAVETLARVRLTKGGKKSYDLLVAGYFNDMFRVLIDVFRVLKKKKKAVFVLGDSAPYGVHIPTEEIIGKIGLGVGFSGYEIKILRTRGGKWKHNPQRHGVELKESILTLTK